MNNEKKKAHPMICLQLKWVDFFSCFVKRLLSLQSSPFDQQKLAYH